MVKFLNNKKGNAFIWLIILIFVFIGISSLVIDYGNLYTKTKKIKYTMNRAVKAAALQVKDGEDLANGNFKIDEDTAKEAFFIILADDLGLDRTTLEPLSNSILSEKPIVKELEVINDTPIDYTSPNINQTYNMENPSVIAVLEFNVKSVFLSKNVVVDKLSSSQLTSEYD